MSLHDPNDPGREFDAHIYYDEAEIGNAAVVRERFLTDFRDIELRVGRMHRGPIGPHPVPMFEINFRKELFRTVLDWFLTNRSGHTVLIHEVTGDDWRDHSEGALWLGEPVAIDFEKLDPSLS